MMPLSVYDCSLVPCHCTLENYSNLSCISLLISCIGLDRFRLVRIIYYWFGYVWKGLDKFG